MIYDDPYDIQSFFHVAMDRKIPDMGHFTNGIKLNIGAGSKQIKDCHSLDLPEYDADVEPIPFPDETISIINAFHFLEHVKNPVEVLQEFQRVLRPGGIANICVPYYSANIAYQDLDHKHFFTEETWKTLFSNPYYNKNKIEWRFKIGMNIIIGVAERNLCLLTQLLKR